MKESEMTDKYREAMKDFCQKECCYLTNNNFAYKIDAQENWRYELKFYNFVPSCDKYCLFCNFRYAEKRCSECKSVYFCDERCQKGAWAIHQMHCKRDLFTICINCGASNAILRCKKCPVKFCSIKCKKNIYKDHLKFDCKNLIKFKTVEQNRIKSKTPSA